MKYLKWTIPITAILAILFVGLGIYVTQAEKPVQSAVNGSQAQVEPLNADKIFALVNEERLKHGLNPLVMDAEISTVSQVKADDMVARNYYAHDDPLTGKNPAWDNPIWKQKCMHSGENINTGPNPTNENIVSSWMSSKPHHDAILNPSYTTSGIAVNRNIVVQHFCQSK